MNDIPESEARELLKDCYVCEDSPSWVPMRGTPGTLEIGIGMLDQYGKSVGMYVELNYQHSMDTKKIIYKFTVFQRRVYRPERVYQLHVKKFDKPVHDAHQMSHEHFGDKRIEGNAAWQEWEYEDVISYFCKQTNIEFRPAIPHPEQLELR